MVMDLPSVNGMGDEGTIEARPHIRNLQPFRHTAHPREVNLDDFDRLFQKIISMKAISSSLKTEQKARDLEKSKYRELLLEFLRGLADARKSIDPPGFLYHRK